MLLNTHLPIARKIYGYAGIALLLGMIIGIDHWCRLASWDVQAGNSRLQEQVASVAEGMIGQSLVRMSQGSLCSQVRMRVPDVGDCNVSRKLPDHLTLYVESRHVQALWANRGKVFLVDQYGEAFRALQKGEVRDLPVLRIPEEELVRVTSLMAQLEQNNAMRWVDSMSEWTGRNGFWNIYFANQQQWLLPKTSRVSSDIEVLLSMLDKPAWKNQWWQVDARVEGRWFFKPVSWNGEV